MQSHRFDVGAVLAEYERREQEMQTTLAHLAASGPAHVYHTLLRVYTRELAQINMRRKLLQPFVEKSGQVEVN